MPTSNPTHYGKADQRLVRTAQVLLTAILIFAPLLRSGQAPIAQLILELLAAGILVVLLWDPHRLPIRRTEAGVLAILFLYPLVYLIPLPAGLTASFPGRDLYAWPPGTGGADPTSGGATISVLPFETESAWLLLVAAIAVFLATRLLGTQQQRQLLWILLGVAAFQVTLGLMQYGAGSGPLYLGMDHAFGNAVGTYTNRNHLAGLVEMVLPITLALLVFSIGRREKRERAHWRRQIAFLGSLRGQAAIGYGALALLLLIGVVFTRSRAGIALTMLGILLATFAFSRRIGGNNVYGLTGTVVASAVGIAIVIGLAPVLDRFTMTGAVENARWSIFSATLTGIGHFFPVGSGPGNYPDAFLAFQPLELGRWFINHAHNDYLEWLFEGGILAAALILLLFGLYLRQWRRVWAPGTWSRMHFIQVGAGIGLLLLALHGLVDFNLHIPANIVYFAFLAGIFFSEPAAQEKVPRRHRHPQPSAEGAAEGTTAPAQPPPLSRAKPPADQIQNPFLDAEGR